ncbi:MAG TPA: hypothetical protein VIS06_17410 [Mycobacteriales bacterium]
MYVTLPSGQQMLTPVDPRTWVEQAPGVAGDPVTSFELEREVASTVAFRRRPLMFQGLGDAQSIPHATWTPIGLTEIWDLARGHNDTSNPSRVEPPPTRSIDNWHLCTGQVPFIGSGSGEAYRIAGLRLNGGTPYEGAKLWGQAAHATTPMVCDLIQAQQGDYLELMAYQRSGGALSTTVSASKVPLLTVRWACVTGTTGTTVTAPGTPRTWTAADILTADSAGTNEVPLNTHVRDVIRWLNYPPAARVDTQGSTQTLTSGSWASITFTGAQLDNYGGWSAAQPSRYTAQRPGLYYVYGLASVGESSGATGYRATRLAVNGSTFYAGTSCTPAPATSAGTALAACAHIRLQAGDYVELQMRPQGNDVPVKSGVGDSSRLVCLWRSL